LNEFAPPRQLKRSTAFDSMEESLFIFVRIPESLESLERAERYEDPLEESLTSSGTGALTGGGAMLSAPDADGNREIQWCGIDIDLFDLDGGLELIRAELKRLGAPKGTMLEYTLDGIAYERDIYEPGVFDLAN
jgi:hypothetical protein